MKQKTVTKTSKNKQKQTRSKKTSAVESGGYKYHLSKLYVALPLAILIILLAGYLARGWVRYHAEPALVSWTADDTQKVLDDQMSALNDPLKRLGITQKNTARQCSLTYADNFDSTIDCASTYQGYLSDTRNLKPDLAQRAAALESTLKSAGWGGAATTITQLGSNISKGIDYTPDATYVKQIGDYLCMASFTTAFSHPKPPAINGLVSCNRYYGILSSPQQPVFMPPNPT